MGAARLDDVKYEFDVFDFSKVNINKDPKKIKEKDAANLIKKNF